MFCLMCYITSKISTNNDMPSGIVLFIEFFFNVCRNVLVFVLVIELKRNQPTKNNRMWEEKCKNVTKNKKRLSFLYKHSFHLKWKHDKKNTECHQTYLFNVVFRKSGRSTIHSILLHFFWHVCILNDCFSLFWHCLMTLFIYVFFVWNEWIWCVFLSFMIMNETKTSILLSSIYRGLCAEFWNSKKRFFDKERNQKRSAAPWG